MNLKVSLLLKEIKSDKIFDSQMELFYADNIIFIPNHSIEIICEKKSIKFIFEEKVLSNKIAKIYELKESVNKYIIGQLYIDNSLVINLEEDNYESKFYQLNFLRTSNSK